MGACGAGISKGLPMLVVGITGGLSTGKSTVAAMLARLGAKVINADRIVHEQMRRTGGCYAPVIKAFGPAIAGKDGIDRKKMAELVFNDKRTLKRLEAIVHPKVLVKIIERVKGYKKETSRGIVVIDVPLLFESGFDRYVDTTMVVSARRSDQLDRARKALNITRTEALRRIHAQMPLRDKIRLADIIIDNSTTRTQTQKQVKAIWQKLTQRAKK